MDGAFFYYYPATSRENNTSFESDDPQTDNKTTIAGSVTASLRNEARAPSPVDLTAELKSERPSILHANEAPEVKEAVGIETIEPPLPILEQKRLMADAAVSCRVAQTERIINKIFANNAVANTCVSHSKKIVIHHHDAFERIVTRIQDAQAASKNQENDSPSMFAYSVFAQEAAYAKRELDRLQDFLATKDIALRVAMRKKIMEYHNNTRSVFSFEAWVRGCRGITTIQSDAADDTIRLEHRAGLYPPWLCIIDAREFHANCTQQLYNIVNQHLVLPLHDNQTNDSAFTVDTGLVPPCVWFICPDKQTTHKMVQHFRPLVSICRRLQPTVLDFSARVVDDFVAKWATDKLCTRRLRCIRVCLGNQAGSGRDSTKLALLFSIFRQLPLSCQRLEVSGADFSYKADMDLWRNACPSMKECHLLLIKPFCISNSIIQELGLTRFAGVSLWDPVDDNFTATNF